MTSSVTIASVTAAVTQHPGHTAYYLRSVAAYGEVTRVRLYRAFRIAERNGLIYSEPNPKRKGSLVWFPMNTAVARAIEHI